MTYCRNSLISVFLLLGLAACGGDHHDDSASTPTTPGTPTSPAIPDGYAMVNMRVVDGPLRNVKVCADLNANGVCDAGEPSAVSDNLGFGFLLLTQEMREKYTCIAEVSTEATDLDNGPVEVAYRMSGPCRDSGVISPLTSLVMIYKNIFGVTVAQATDTVNAMLNEKQIDLDLLGDFTSNTNEVARLQATVARLLVITKQVLLKDVAPVPSPGTVTPEQREQAIRANREAEAAIDRRLMGVLAELFKAATDPTLLAETDVTTRRTALLNKGLLIAAQTGITGQNVADIVSLYKAPPVAPPLIGARMLVNLNYSGVNDYSYSLLNWSAQQPGGPNVPALYTETRFLKSSGPASDPYPEPRTSIWGQDIKRNESYWTGSEWFDCPENFAHQSTITGNGTEFVYCKAYRYTLQTLSLNLEGKTWNTLSSYFANLSINGNPLEGQWKLPQVVDAPLLPSGSRLLVAEKSEQDLPYIHSNVQQVQQIRPEAYCNNAVLPNGRWALATSLADLLARKGDACPAGSERAGTHDYSLLRLDYSDSGAATLGTAISFDAGGSSGKVKLWTCDFFSRCGETGQTGEWSIVEGLGNARILRLSKMPGEYDTRIYVERAGAVYYGVKRNSRLSTVFLVEEELRAYLFNQLGVSLF